MGAVAIMGKSIKPIAVTVAARTAKSLYTRLYIYAKREAIMYKYTATAAVLRGVNSSKILQTWTIFGVIGGVPGHREG